MKVSIFISAAILALATVACDKNNIQQPTAPTGPPKIKKEMDSNGSVTNYEYNDDGKITKITYTNGSKTGYTYATSTVYEKQYDNAGNEVSQSDHETNFLGHVVLTTYGATNISRVNYQYNSSNQLINAHFFTGPLSDSTDRRYYYSAQGRLDSLVVTRNNYTVRVMKYIYEYSLDRPNTVSTVNYGRLYMGEANSNVPVTKYTVVNPDGSIQRVDNYAYEYDANNRISKAIWSPTSFTSFTYY